MQIAFLWHACALEGLCTHIQVHGRNYAPFPGHALSRCSRAPACNTSWCTNIHKVRRDIVITAARCSSSAALSGMICSNIAVASVTGFKNCGCHSFFRSMAAIVCDSASANCCWLATLLALWYSRVIFAVHISHTAFDTKHRGARIT